MSRYEDGSRFAEVSLYRYDTFPLGLIGPVEILWCPDGGKVWIRIHPSIYTEGFDALKSAIADIASGPSVLIHDLREDLGSFEFVGPQSGRLIRRILKICRAESTLQRSVSYRRVFQGVRG